MADMFQTPPAGTPIEPNNGVRCYYRRQILLPTPASKHLHAMGGGKAAKQGSDWGCEDWRGCEGGEPAGEANIDQSVR